MRSPRIAIGVALAMGPSLCHGDDLSRLTVPRTAIRNRHAFDTLGHVERVVVKRRSN